MKRWMFITSLLILLVLIIPLSQGAVSENKAKIESTGTMQGILCHIHSEGKATKVTEWKGWLLFSYNHLSISYVSGNTTIEPPLLPTMNIRINGSQTLDIWFLMGYYTKQKIDGDKYYVTVDGIALLASCCS